MTREAFCTRSITDLLSVVEVHAVVETTVASEVETIAKVTS